MSPQELTLHNMTVGGKTAKTAKKAEARWGDPRGANTGGRGWELVSLRPQPKRRETKHKLGLLGRSRRELENGDGEVDGGVLRFEEFFVATRTDAEVLLRVDVTTRSGGLLFVVGCPHHWAARGMPQRALKQQQEESKVPVFVPLDHEEDGATKEAATHEGEEDEEDLKKRDGLDGSLDEVIDRMRRESESSHRTEEGERQKQRMDAQKKEEEVAVAQAEERKKDQAFFSGLPDDSGADDDDSSSRSDGGLPTTHNGDKHRTNTSKKKGKASKNNNKNNKKSFEEVAAQLEELQRVRAHHFAARLLEYPLVPVGRSSKHWSKRTHERTGGRHQWKPALSDGGRRVGHKLVPLLAVTNEVWQLVPPPPPGRYVLQIEPNHALHDRSASCFHAVVVA
jgi:hypothetical protein